MAYLTESVSLLVHGLHMLAENRDVIKDTHGNLSVRDGDEVFIKPSGVEYANCNLVNVYQCEVSGRHGGGPLNPSVDLPHHLSIYQRHPWVKAICHTHSPYATAFAMAGLDIECYSTEQADYFGGTIYCRGYSDLYSWGDDLEFDQEEKAVLLSSHGCLTFAADPIKAVKLAIALENVAQKTWLTKQLRGYAHPLREEEVKKWHKRYQESYGQPSK